MSDPLSDPRAQALMSADPSEVSGLAAQFQRVASHAETAMHGLQGVHSAADWAGLAADLFREKLGKLPGDLRKVAQSHGDAATALSTYANDLGPLKSRFSALVPQIQGAQNSVTTAQGTLGSAKGALTTAQSAKGAQPTDPSVTGAATAVSSAGGAVTRAQGTLDGLAGRARQLLDEFDHVRGQARSAISRAATIAPQDHSNWFTSALGAVGDFMKATGKFIADAAVSVYQAARHLPGDFAYLSHHMNDLKAWSKMAGDLGTVAGAVALVAAVLVCPLDLVGLEGAAAVLAATDSVAGAVATGVTADRAIWDTTLAAQGKGSWGEVGFDAFSLATGGAKIPGLRAASKTSARLEGTATAFEKYAGGRSAGLTASQAYSKLSSTQQSLLSASTSAVTSNQSLNTIIASTTAAAGHASKVEHVLKAGNEVIHGGVDHAKELAHERLLPEHKVETGAAAGSGQGG